MSTKAFKYRIYANERTTEKLQWVLDRCRELYNAGLQERRDAYEIGVRRHPNYYDDEARKQLTREHAVGYSGFQPNTEENASRLRESFVIDLLKTPRKLSDETADDADWQRSLVVVTGTFSRGRWIQQ